MTEGEDEDLVPGVGEHALSGLAGTEIQKTAGSIADKILETEEIQKAMNLMVEVPAFMCQRVKSA